MSAFKEDVFFSTEVQSALAALRNLEIIHGGKVSARFRRDIKKGVRNIEELLYWFERRQAVLRAPSPRPFLFSGLRKELSKKTKKLYCPPASSAMSPGRDSYISSRLTDLTEAIAGVRGSLAISSGRDVSLLLEQGDGFVTAVMEFKSWFNGFDLRAFCQRMAWDDGKGSGSYPGFPFLEAVLQNGNGSFNWMWGGGRWSLKIDLPALPSEGQSRGTAGRDVNSRPSSRKRE